MLPYYFQIPLGVILAILDPVLIAVLKSGHAVIAGKSIVLKPPTQVFISLIQKLL